MILSEDRQSHWAHLLTDQVYENDFADFTDDDQALRATKKAITEFVKEFEQMDTNARDKVRSLKRTIIEGTSEWDTMYGKYFKEERAKRGQS